MSFSGRVVSTNSSRRGRILAAACALALLFASAACKSDYPASGQQKGPGEGRGGGGGAARQVKMGRVEEMPVGSSVNVTGTLAAQDLYVCR